MQNLKIYNFIKIAVIITVLIICFNQSKIFGQSNWLIQAGSTSLDEAYDLALDASNNSYTCGYFTGVCTFGSNPGITLTASPITDLFVAKTDANGNLVWVTQAGGPGPDRALAIAADAAGNTYITGYFHGTVNFGNISLSSDYASQDIFVAKIDANGKFLWAKKAGG